MKLERIELLVVALMLAGCGGGGTSTLSTPTIPGVKSATSARLSLPSVTNKGVAPARLPGETVRQYLERAAPKISDSEVDSRIDADITGTDRSIIKKVMLAEPPYARENVAYVDRKGHIYSNHKAMAAATTISPPVPGKPGLFYDRAGRVFAGPPVTEKPVTTTRSGMRTPSYGQPPAVAHSGPYRRVYSDPSVWYSGGMHVMIPRFATNSTMVGPYGDIGYVYSGGFSSSGRDGADAGLQYSAARDVSNVFINVYSSSLGQIDSNYRNFAPNNDDEVDFIIGSGGCTSNCSFDSGFLTSFTWGAWAGGGVGGDTLAVQPSNFGDWTADGVVLKDMVTIGQVGVGGMPDGVAYDGYSFGFIATLYCGWDGPYFSACLSNSQDPGGYHLEQRVPNSNVVLVNRQSGSYYENVGIQL